MSMLSAQVDELRAMTESVGLAMPQAATLMMDAADTIEGLETENAKLRERGAKTLEVGTRWMAKAARFESENTKLRELVALCIVIDKHMSLCATTDCGQCSVREECGESVYLEGLLGIDPKGLSWRVQERMAETTDVQAENAKLRELMADMLRYYAMPNDIDYKREAALLERARELGVEVPDGD